MLVSQNTYSDQIQLAPRSQPLLYELAWSIHLWYIPSKLRCLMQVLDIDAGGSGIKGAPVNTPVVPAQQFNEVDIIGATLVARGE